MLLGRGGGGGVGGCLGQECLHPLGAGIGLLYREPWRHAVYRDRDTGDRQRQNPYAADREKHRVAHVDVVNSGYCAYGENDAGADQLGDDQQGDEAQDFLDSVQVSKRAVCCIAVIVYYRFGQAIERGLLHVGQVSLFGFPYGLVGRVGHFGGCGSHAVSFQVFPDGIQGLCDVDVHGEPSYFFMC